MTNEFKELTRELALGFNFPENAVIFATALRGDFAYDTTVHFGSQYYEPTEYLVQSIVKEFLRPLKGDLLETARKMILDVIEEDKQDKQGGVDCE